MGQISIQFDNTLEKSSITMPLISSSSSQAGDEYSGDQYTDKMQTSVFGVQVPLIMINNTVIDFDAIKQFSLKSSGVLPELSITVEDRYELITNIDKPGLDNEIRIQILPRFDNAYKKINLTFYTSSISVSGKNIRLTGSYKLSKLTSTQFKSFGKISTYNLFKNAAIETNLGFATNITNTNDERFIYCNNKSLLELMNSEIQFSDTTTGILDYWIDFWDNINLADIKERYTTVDASKDIEIWVAGSVHEVGKDNEPQPIKIEACLSNHPGFNNSELYVKNYKIVNNPGIQMIYGSDKVYATYEENKNEYIDYLLQDGDIKNDIFTKFEYLGEIYGDYNYLLSKSIREGFLQKMNSESIVVTLQSPLLGLMRGHKVNFIRYVNNSLIENKLKSLEEKGLIDRNINSNIPLDEYDSMPGTSNGRFRLDRSVSGQYLISEVNISYSKETSWEYKLTLVRSAIDKPKLINE